MDTKCPECYGNGHDIMNIYIECEACKGTGLYKLYEEKDDELLGRSTKG